MHLDVRGEENRELLDELSDRFWGEWDGLEVDVELGVVVGGLGFWGEDLELQHVVC